MSLRTNPSTFTTPRLENGVLLPPATTQSPAIPTDDPTLHLPRILCLHGGGTNARIFRTQCRALRLHLAPFFRLVFADAPFFSQAGPDVESVYAEWGPFRSWQRPGFGPGTGLVLLGPEQGVVVEKIEKQIEAAMREDDQVGATGGWVGILGFSQGAKLAASILLRQQDQSGAKEQRQSPWRQSDYRFGVIMAGRAPMMSLDPDMGIAEMTAPCLLQVPTIHVHGLQDPGLSFHRVLHCHCCTKESTRLIEWDGNHRLPIKTKDVTPIVTEILDVANKSNVFQS